MSDSDQPDAAQQTVAHEHEHTDEHTHDPEPKWELWQKERLFVRALKGIYGDVYQQVLAQPRVYSSTAKPFKGGPVRYGKTVVAPQAAEITQMIECHIDAYAPGAKSQKHGHMNSAVFYILDGTGYDVHDGVRYDWQAGDVCIVENSCVHQHFNADPQRQAVVLIMKAKPLFLFAHLVYQKIVEYPSEEPMPGFESYYPTYPLR